MTKPAPSLSRRERQILDTIYRLSRATVAEVRDAIEDPPSYSSIRTLMGVLEGKGHLQHRQDGPRYVYEATVPRSQAGGAALRRVVSTFFAGSITDLVSTLVREDVDPATLNELAALIESAKQDNE
jgi:predicted transcriptional regulator